MISFILLLVQAFVAYMPSSHNDDGLYYSTSIKWMREFGTIPVLANINPRIGFNSSWLGLQALFGFFCTPDYSMTSTGCFSFMYL